MLSLGLLLVSAFILVVPVGLAFLLGTLYVRQFPRLSAVGRTAYPAVIGIVLAPIAWPYVERLAAHQRCAELQKSDQFSVFHTESIRVEFQGDRGIFTPDYLLIDTIGRPEWILKTNVRHIVSKNGTREFTRHAPGEECNSITQGEPYGYDLCQKSANSDLRASLNVIFKTVAATDNKGSATVVSFVEDKSARNIAIFHSFRWFPSFGSFALGSDLPFTCGDRHDFSKFFQQVLGN